MTEPVVWTGALSRVEQRRLDEAERVIEAHMTGFIAVGTMLLRIREERLYREQFQTFDTYMEARWGLSHSRGAQTIWAAAVYNQLEDAGVQPLPGSELVARQFTPLRSQGREDLVVDAWKTAVEMAEKEGARRPMYRHARAAVRHVAYLHSAYRENLGDGDEVPDAMVLPDVVLRDMQSLANRTRASLERTADLSLTALRHLDPAWRRDVRDQIEEVRELLAQWHDRLDKSLPPSAR